MPRLVPSRLSLALPVLALLVCAPVAAPAHRSRLPSTGLPKIAYARPTPDFVFDAAGMATHLAAFRGKPVVLNFWATWCEPCAAELPVFARLHESFGGDVALITVSDESPDVTRPFLQAHGVDAFSVADPDRKIFSLYGITPLPVTIVLDRSGDVTHVSVGELDWNELQTAVTAASSSLGTGPGGGL